MTAEEQAVAEIQQHIAGLSVSAQWIAQAYARMFRQLVKDSSEARIALILVGAEMAAQP